MSKYTKKAKEPLVAVSMKIEQSSIDEVEEIHSNFSEFARDAIKKLIAEQKAVLKEVGL